MENTNFFMSYQQEKKNGENTENRKYFQYIFTLNIEKKKTLKITYLI